MSAALILLASLSSVLPSSLSEIQAWRQRRVVLKDASTNNKQYQTLHLTFATFVASRAAIFGLEVERSGEVLVVSAKILHSAMAEILMMH